MSFPNLDHLLVLPSGCGEQNLVKTSVNYVVAKYLSSTSALHDNVAIKIKNNLQIGRIKIMYTNTFILLLFICLGYQKQLNYMSSSGCYSIWPSGACSSW